METLLQQAQIDMPKLRKLIHGVTARELSNLSEPCYYPSIKKYYYELLHACKLTEKDIRAFVKRFYAGHQALKWKLQTDPITNFYIFLMYVCLNRREISAYNSLLIFFHIRYYTNLMNKQIQYCNKDVFKYALEHLTQTHLFIREKSIPGAIYFISKEMDKSFREAIRHLLRDKIILFITTSRSRLSQSVKSFATLYYKANKEGLGIREPYEDEQSEDSITYQQSEKTSRVINDVVKNITVYRVIDQKAINDARQITKIRTSIATMIAKGITKTKYSDNIKTILEMFIKDITRVDQLCGDAFLVYVRSLMSIKRTTATIYFKQQVTSLLIDVMTDLEYIEEFKKLTPQTQSLINLFLAYYITMSMRNSTC